MSERESVVERLRIESQAPGGRAVVDTDDLRALLAAVEAAQRYRRVQDDAWETADERARCRDELDDALAALYTPASDQPAEQAASEEGA